MPMTTARWVTSKRLEPSSRSTRRPYLRPPDTRTAVGAGHAAPARTRRPVRLIPMVVHAPGRIAVLNGAPRSGKSSIAAAVQDRLDGVWMNLGVDTFVAATPARIRPGIGLRPGGERPDLEAIVPALYEALYASV